VIAVGAVLAYALFGRWTWPSWRRAAQRRSSHRQRPCNRRRSTIADTSVIRLRHFP